MNKKMTPKIGYECNECDNSWIDTEACFYCDQCRSPDLTVYNVNIKEITTSSSSANNHSQQLRSNSVQEERVEDTVKQGMTHNLPETISADICTCGHHTNDHSYDSKDILCDNLYCDKCDCISFTQTKSSASKLRTGQEILDDISYEEKKGTHTFTMCKCGRQGCRGSKCVLCLNEEFMQKDLYSQSKPSVKLVCDCGKKGVHTCNKLKTQSKPNAKSEESQ